MVDNPTIRQDDIDAYELNLAQSIQGRADKLPYGDNPIGGYGVDSAFYDGGMLFSIGTVTESIPEWSVWTLGRDRALRRFYKTEPIAAGATYSMTARLKALEYNLSGGEEKHDAINAMFRQADLGNGIRTLLSKTVLDLSTQDNGAFWELTGDGNPESELLGGVVTGFNHLDSQQCYRTFDPEYPVVYIDPTNGKRHKLHRTRVYSMSSMPQSNELARGIGFCPLSRALLSVQLMKAFQTYRYEKASGKFDRAIGYGTGMTMATLRKLLQNVDFDDEAEGFVRFGRIPFFVSPRTEVTLQVLDLASIPDGFDLKTETEIYVYSLALAFGVDAREFWPATQTGATKGDASIQNMKARGKGLADLITIIEDGIRNRIIPADVDFNFDFVDDEHDTQIAETNKVRVDTVIAMKNAGIINDVQAQAILIAEGVLDENTLIDADQAAIPFEGDSLDESPDEPNPLDPTMQQVNNPANVTTFNGAEAVDGQEADKAQKTISQYRSALHATALGLWELYLRPMGAVTDFDSSIRRHLTEAAYAGLKEAGLLVGDLEVAELNEIQTIIFNEQMYVVDLVQWIIGVRESTNGSMQMVYNRLDMWVARYDMVKSKFLLIGNKNKKKQWKRGKTKKGCIDCIGYDGKVYRANIWLKYDIQPKMYDLTCRGGHCDCGFYDTDEPIDRGFPAKPKGR